MHLSPDFIAFAKDFFGSEYNDFIESLNRQSPTSVRINQAKIRKQLVGKPVPWCDSARYLDERPAFTFDPLFHAGCYYVQEASSGFLEQVFKKYIDKPVCMLDLCAAPGGKSTHSLSLLPEGSLLVSNEVIRSRTGVLFENISKWGYPNVIITNNDAVDFKKVSGFFDVVLVDAPCSGEGMFRKDPESAIRWSLNHVSLCAERQRRILNDVWPCLKPGGLLIYSTCTYNLRENEENIHWLTQTFDAEILPLDIEEFSTISTPVHPNVYRFFPHKTEGEGFALAVIRKSESKNEDIVRIKQKKLKEIAIPDVRNWLTDSDKFRYSVRNNIITAFPSEYVSELAFFESELNVVSAGIPFAELKGKSPSPTQSLAESLYINKKMFDSVEIDYKEAVCYLRKETLVLPPETPKTYILLTYNNVPLGFVKNIGNRANNLYPQERRIRTSFENKNPCRFCSV